MMRSRKSISLSLSLGALGAGFGLNGCAAGWVRPRSEVASTFEEHSRLITAMLLSLGTSPVGQTFFPLYVLRAMARRWRGEPV